jgi:hypothetical protein
MRRHSGCRSEREFRHLDALVAKPSTEPDHEPGLTPVTMSPEAAACRPARSQSC